MKTTLLLAVLAAIIICVIGFVGGTEGFIIASVLALAMDVLRRRHDI